MEYVLTTHALCKNYQHFKALNGLSMNVPKGAIYGFVGQNGAGKTTLIRLICGLQKASSGEYALYGISGTDKGIVKARKRIGAIIETPSLYQDMSAAENLKMQYRILGLPSFRGIPELLELVGLGDTGRKKVKNFSLGMRQRLGIAAALAGEPDFLILDEPVNGLDPQGIIEIRELILKLNRQRRITVLISSHILDELSRLATHYGFIDNGRIVKEISAKELEMSCRKCSQLEVSNIKALAHVLDNMQIEYTILSDTRADIYTGSNLAVENPADGSSSTSGNNPAAGIKPTELVLALKGAGCDVLSMREKDESLESYYINLIGRDVDKKGGSKDE